METMGFSEQLKDPFLLGGGTSDGIVRPEDKDVDDVFWDEDVQSFVAPFMMAPINTRVVRRSSQLLNYGKRFSYNEGALAFSERLGKKMKRQAMTSVERRLEMREAGFLPKPGEGPDAETRAKSFKMQLIAESEDGARCKASVCGGDPGYDETAKMAASAAILLATKKEQLLQARPGGVLTPAAAFGRHLTSALHQAGITFECEPLPPRSKM